MGFAVAAATLIVATALAFAGGAALDAWFDTIERVHDAEEASAERHRVRHETTLNITSVVQEKAPLPGLGKTDYVEVKVRNDGLHVLRPDLVTVLLDGHVEDAKIVNRTIEGVTSYDSLVWAPGDVLVIHLAPVKDAPTSVRVVCGNGATARSPAGG